jgi:hypothetical protein
MSGDVLAGDVDGLGQDESAEVPHFDLFAEKHAAIIRISS